MAAGVNVKMGVSGVSQFKQGMKEAQSAVKTLDQQLKLNEAQFKQTGDAETYMQQKTETLQKQIEAQKSVVQQAERALETMRSQGVNPTSQAFQNMQQQMLKAQTDLTNMQTNLNEVGTAGEEACNGISEMNANLRRVGEGVTFQNVKDGLDTLTGWIEGAIRKAWNLGEAIVKNTLGVGQWADELLEESAKYGISVEDLQRMHKTANMVDTDTESILAARDKMVKNIKQGNKEAMGAVAAMNQAIDPRNFTDSQEAIEDLFWMTGEWIASLEDAGDQEMYSMALFGKSWRDLLPLFKTGRKEYDETMASWSVLEEDQVKQLGEMDDQYQQMTGEWETFKAEILSAFSGPLTEGMATITDLFRQLNAYLDTPEGQAMLKQMGDTISSLITDLTQVDPETVVSGLKSVIDGITDALKWISEHKDEVVTALEGIVAGWAALKVTGGVLKILELIQGLQWLKTNPNIQIPHTTGGSPVTGGNATQTGITGTGSLGIWLAKTFPTLAGTAGSLAAFDPTGLTALIPSILGDQTTFGRWLRNGASFGEAAGASWETVKASANEAVDNWGKYVTEQMPNAFWGALGVEDANDLEFKLNHGSENLQRSLFGGGSDLSAYAITDEDLKRSQLDMAVKMDRMAQEASETSANTQHISQNSVTSADIQTLTGLPAAVATAVENGMARVQIIIGAGAVDAIGARIGGSIGGQVVAMTK